MASKIKVDQIQTADGSGTIALQNQLSGMTSASMPTGSVLQVVQSTANTESSTNSQSFQTVLTQAITPSSTNNKILIMTQGTFYCTVSSGYRSILTIFRDSTNIGTDGDSMLTMTKDSAGNGVKAAMSINYVDSPSTTSAISYTLKIRQNNGGGDSYWSYEGATTTLILMEIAG